MTSKNSLPTSASPIRMIIDTIKRHTWLFALAIVLAFFAMPVTLALQLQSAPTLTPSNTEQYLQQMTNMVNYVTNPDYIPMTILFIGAAIISAVVFFGYLHSKKQVDFYHSLPIKREKLFLIRYLSGLLIIYIPYLINCILSLLIILAFGDIAFLSLGEFFGALGRNLLFFTAIYTIGVLAGVVCGNRVIHLLGTGILLGIGPLLISFYAAVMETFYQTFYSALFPINELCMYSSPVAAFFNPNSQMIILWAVLTVLFFLLSLFLYKKRPSEGASHAIAFRYAKPIIKYPLVFISTIAMGLLFHMVGDHGSGQIGFWLIFGFLCGAFLSHAIIEIIYHFDFKAAFGNKKGFLIFAICFFLLASVPLFDLTGYDDFTVEAADVEAISLRMVDVESYGYSSRRRQSNDYDYSRTTILYALQRDTFRDRDNIEQALALIEQVKESRVQEEEYLPGGAAVEMSTDIALLDPIPTSEALYGGRNNANTTSVGVIYTLKNGKQIARDYGSVNLDLIEEPLSNLLSSPEYRENHYDLLKADVNLELQAIYTFDMNDYIDTRDLRPELCQAIVDAYIQDFRNFDLTQNKTELPLGVLEFSVTSQDAESGATYTNTLRYPLYASFSQTEAALAPLGRSFDSMTLKPEQVSSITLLDDYNKTEDGPDLDYYREVYGLDLTGLWVVNDEDAYNTYAVIHDPAMIETILANSASEEALAYNPFINADYYTPLEILIETETFSTTCYRYLWSR